MINGESWLFHSSLFDDWIIVRKDFVRSLGWFEKIFKMGKSHGGWLTVGKKPIHDADALEMIVQDNAEKTLFCLNDNRWQYLPGPVILACHGKIVGYAGPKTLIKTLEASDPNPWNWPNLQVIEVVPQVTKFIPVSGHSSPFERFRNLADISHGWMWWPETPEESFAKETMDAITTDSPIIEVKDGVWFLNSLKITVSDIQITPGFDIHDLRDALENCKSEYAWVSEQRSWTGWLPKDRFELEKVHVWPDEHGVIGAELFIPVERFLNDTEGKTDLNSLNNLAIYDKQL